MWHAFHSSNFIPTITGVSSSMNSATTGFLFFTRLDQISASAQQAYSNFCQQSLSRSLSTIKFFASRRLPNLCLRITPLSSLLSLTILLSTQLNALWPGAFAAKKNASRPFSTKLSIEQFTVFSYLRFSSASPLSRKNYYLYYFFLFMPASFKTHCKIRQRAQPHHILKMSKCR